MIPKTYIDAWRTTAPWQQQDTLAGYPQYCGLFSQPPTKDGYARMIPFEEICDNDYNLNIPRNIDIVEEEENTGYGSASEGQYSLQRPE